ncbi:MAG: sigma-70 family RNA polymerase sigma factor [Candidatus Limiplasma sp.]|nr:sigma-70 family RNA polymerase sigma factor [Candidatus Limiplasma sp.]
MNDALVPGSVQEEALRRIMTEYGTSLLRLCYVYVKDAHLAQDAVQETFLKVYQKYPTFRHECGEKSWVMRIAINICKDILRTPWIRRVDRSMPLEERLGAAGDAGNSDSFVLAEVMKLPAKYKDVILLRYYENMKLAEISASLRISERTVRSRLGQANQRLRQRLKGWYFDEE